MVNIFVIILIVAKLHAMVITFYTTAQENELNTFTTYNSDSENRSPHNGLR